MPGLLRYDKDAFISMWRLMTPIMKLKRRGPPFLSGLALLWIVLSNTINLPVSIEDKAVLHSSLSCRRHWTTSAAVYQVQNHLN